jgi:hypothetical protein
MDIIIPIKIKEYNIHFTPGFTIRSPFSEIEGHFVFTMVDFSDSPFKIEEKSLICFFQLKFSKRKDLILLIALISIHFD